MAKAKKLDFRPTAPTLAEDESGVTRDIWLATWGVVAIFIIVVLVLYFTGMLGGAFGATTGGAVYIPPQSACLKGNAVTSILDANRFIAVGYRCDYGLIPGVRCCYIP